ncbi:MULTISPECIES: GMC family oxidoreductase [Dyadobacter]|uniref:GMC family oxidoreductase n=1 Tax=Dyadobacter chenhuakuii TaxID=2909339 RepID=A0A9X1Q9I9_9BACT|nr:MULTISPECIES: GMC family oxidoreductase [Dyadobacter]MCE7070329.1 GMC family oxidoreductase [Dyadobacter sp. CY327]MCF2488854.1 GMC family oxidoreductase [Dyadobacter sp. CY347]MCF2492628.1 GMC family oxidoreductase [Dyadobacter chenhuakuii]MCF2496964.1 GMC family oxidoreductase [Dyadobacter chenhuakuii]MCF2520356.1 GMC family oxidoreductase [Dyadobacter sp. CY351]
MFQIKEQPAVFDVCIIGSGAGGGMAALQLAQQGAKVALLEAGGYFDPADPKYITQLKWPYESPRRGASNHRPFGDFDAAWGGWELEGEPYTRKNGTQFDWFRSRMLGGRTNHWGRISLRFGPKDFKRKSIDGLGDDWPIGYDDVKPYYDKVDKLIGVFGTVENMDNEPDGIFLPPPKPRLHELFIKQAGKKANIPVIPSRLSILTKPINDQRGVCFYCSQCSRACQAYADFSSSSVLCIPAVKTGNVTLINNAMAREVLTDPVTGLATGVSYVDSQKLTEHTIKAKVVVLAASAGESARLLLNSKSDRHPNGLANSSGVVGRYLHDSTGASRGAFLPHLMDRKRYNEDGVGGMHVYTPWWLDNKKLDFPRGYHIEYGGGMGMPSYGFGAGIENMNGKYPTAAGVTKPAGGYGSSLKEDYRRFYGAYVGMAGRGEAVPNFDNYCEIDPNVVDKFGIPVLRFHYKWTDYEIKQAKHMHDTFEEIIHALGGVASGTKPGADTNYGIAAPGRIIHEVGTVRMGNDPKTSALNKFSQAHDAKNVFVVDGGSFVSQADKNPTWTILALSMRASEYITEQVKQKNI